MREIRLGGVAVFLGLFIVILALGVVTTHQLLGGIPLGDFRGVILVAAGIVNCYLYAFGLFRVFYWLMPVPEGEIAPNSSAEFAYHVYVLFFLTIFYPVLCGGLIPLPLMRVVYQALGARMGRNTYTAGVITDPPFLQLGDNTVVGAQAYLVAHVIEGTRLAIYPIRIGSHVTIGARSMVLAGVTIEDYGTVAIGAVVPKGTHIGRGEVWGGIPARLLRTRNPGEAGEVAS